MAMSRRCAEELLLLSGSIYAIWILRSEWKEHAVAGEIGLLVGLAVLYRFLRVRPAHTHRTSHSFGSGMAANGTRSPSPVPGMPSSLHNGHIRDRSGKSAMGQFLHAKEEIRHRPPLLPSPPSEEEGIGAVGSRGCVWGTEDREYRECLDDGVLFALLLGPLVAAAMLHCTLRLLSQHPPPLTAAGPTWYIEPPLVLPSTPMRYMDPAVTPMITDALLALSALATSRRNLVQLFTLCSFVLLVHLVRSLVLEIGQAKASGVPASVPMTASASTDQDLSDPNRSSPSHTYWLKRGEWKRNVSAVGFSTIVTGGCIIVKAVTAYIGHGVWSDMSPSDVVLATLFYQFSLYVCVRLARRGFTLGELGLVCHAATALFMETVNLTRMKIAILRTPYIKTYRLPTPLLTFQLALIPGSLLTGFLLSPLLYLSRHLAQRPAHRLRFPHEKPVHRRLLALGFYAGSALVCGGIVGTWTKWCLDWRDPYIWVVFWLMSGRRPWTRPALITYWGLLAAVAVAGWSRQLSRARRHRRYVVPGPRDRDRDRDASTNTAQDRSPLPLPEQKGSSSPRRHSHTAPQSTEQTRLSGVASQMMDAADQRLPTLSVNARRKSFHALAVIMFVPGIALDPAFTHLAFSVAFAAFTFAEYVRYFALWPFGVSVHLFLNEFLDAKDSGTAILSHFYLLAGCASPLWLEGRCEILSLFGVISLGIGDAIASVVGRRFGRVKWSVSIGKTVEGSIAFFVSVLASALALRFVGLCEAFNVGPFAICTALVTLLEAVSAQNDNLVLPTYGWAIGTLLGV